MGQVTRGRFLPAVKRSAASLGLWDQLRSCPSGLKVFAQDSWHNLPCLPHLSQCEGAWAEQPKIRDSTFPSGGIGRDSAHSHRNFWGGNTMDKLSAFLLWFVPLSSADLPAPTFSALKLTGRTSIHANNPFRQAECPGAVGLSGCVAIHVSIPTIRELRAQILL